MPRKFLLFFFTVVSIFAFTAVANATTGPAGSSAVVTPESSSFGQIGNIDLAYRSADEHYLSVWTKTLSGVDSIQTRLLDSDGTVITSSLGDIHTLTTTGSSHYYYHPRVYVTRRGYVIVYTHEYADGGMYYKQLEALELNAEGEALAKHPDPIVLQQGWYGYSGPLLVNDFYSAAVNPRTDEITIAYLEITGSSARKLYAVTLNNENFQQSNTLDVTNIGWDTTYGWYAAPKIAYNPDKNDYILVAANQDCHGSYGDPQLCSYRLNSEYNTDSGSIVLQRASDSNILVGSGSQRIFDIQYSPIDHKYLVLHNGGGGVINGVELNEDGEVRVDGNNDPDVLRISSSGFTSSLASFFNPLNNQLGLVFDKYNPYATTVEKIGVFAQNTLSNGTSLPTSTDSAERVSDRGDGDSPASTKQTAAAYNPDLNQAVYMWTDQTDPEVSYRYLATRVYNYGFYARWNEIRAQVNVTSVSESVADSGSGTPDTFALTDGYHLPHGLGIDADTGSITGTVDRPVNHPTTVTTYVDVADTASDTITVPVTFRLLPDPATQARLDQQKNNVGDPIDPVTGNMNLSHQDLLLPSRGPSTQVVRTYNSIQPEDGMFGYGWAGIYGAHVDTTPRENVDGTTTDVATLIDYNSAQLVFEKQEDGSYEAPSRIFEVLQKNTGSAAAGGAKTWELTRQNGVKWFFRADGHLTSIQDRNGNEQTFQYGAGAPTNDQLTSVTDPLGREVDFVYGTSGLDKGHVVEIDAPGSRGYAYDYDSKGNLTSYTDATGAETTYEYEDSSNPDKEHLLTNVHTPGDEEYPAGHQSFTYDSDSLKALTSSGYSNYQQVTLEYNEGDQETSITDARDNTSVYHYNDAGQITQIDDPDSHSISYIYDTDGNKTSSIDANGKTTDYTYDDHGNVLTATKPKPHDSDSSDARPVTTMEYNDYSQPTSITDPLGKETTFEYDSDGNLTTVTNPRGKETVTTYNSHGQPLTVTDANDHETDFTYGTSDSGANDHGADNVGRLVAVTNARGKTTQYRYNASGNVTSTTDPLDAETAFTYDKENRTLTTTLPEVVTDQTDTITNEYDPRGNLISITDPYGKETTNTFTRNDQLASTTDPTDKTTSYTYDDMGNLTGVTDPAGNETTSTYTKQGWLDTVTQPDGSTGRVTSFEYDANGNPTSKTNARGKTTSYDYDNLNRVTGVTDALSHETTVTYDKNNQTTSITNPNSHTTSFEYDDNGNVISKTNALSKTWEYTYDNVDNLDTVTDPNGQETDYSYNAIDQPTSIEFPGTTSNNRSYTYDDNGQPLQIAKGSNQVNYTYDDRGQTLTEEQHHSSTDHTTLTYTYDRDGRVKSLDVPTRPDPIDYSYDDAGRITSVTDAHGSEYSYNYDTAGRLDNVTNPDTASGHPSKQSYEYDADTSQINSIKQYNGSTTPFRQFDYSYDKDGNVTGIADSKNGSGANTGTRTGTLAYDDLDRLTSESYVTGTSPSTTTHSRAYTYDAAGNRTGLSVDGGTSQTSTYNNGEQLTASPGQTYSYDDNGQLTAQTDTGTSAVTNYTYDPTGQVTSEGSDTFENDPIGRRIKESHSSTDTSFFYDGNDVIQSKSGSDDPLEYTRDTSGSLLGEHVPGSTPETYNYYTDLLGSVTGLSKANTTNNPENSMTYNAFGDVVDNTGSTPNLFGYLGNASNPAGKTDNFHARSYDTANGRFLSTDPIPGSINAPQTFNPYAYGANNPYSNPDPTGLCLGGVQLTCDVFNTAISPASNIVDRFKDAANVIAGNLTSEQALNNVLQNGLGAISIGYYLFQSAQNCNSISQNTLNQAGLGAVDNEYVDLISPERRNHILIGDRNGRGPGGGHAFRATVPNKSHFSASWSDDKIIHEISDIATDPSLVPELQRNGNWAIVTERDDIEIKVILNHNKTKIITGYPTEDHRNE